MHVSPSEIPGLLVIEGRVFADSRGAFTELWTEERYREAGITARFVQDNVSWSGRHVLRGLHFQFPHSQGKLVSVLHGEVFDVAVDIRLGSPTFGRWTGYALSERSGRQLYIPEGFAHGFVVLSDSAVFAYKCTDYHQRAAECVVRWDDVDLGIEWPVGTPQLSERDRTALSLRDVPRDRLPCHVPRSG